MKTGDFVQLTKEPNVLFGRISLIHGDLAYIDVFEDPNTITRAYIINSEGDFKNSLIRTHDIKFLHEIEKFDYE